MNQVAIQAAKALLMVLTDVEVGPQPTTVTSFREPQRQWQGRPIPVKPTFNSDTQDRYVELMNFEMEVMNILESKAYELN